MSFQLSPELDKNKVFLIYRSELEGRLDPGMARYQKRITQFKFDTVHLSKLLRRKPQYGANEVGIDRISIEQPRYVRITDINEYGLLKQEIGKTADNVEPKYLLKNNELLFGRSGSVGKSYIHKTENVTYPCFYAGYMIRFIVNENKINPDYLFAYTQSGVYKEWVIAIQRTAVQPNINAEEYQSLEIPLPPIEKQAEIVAHITSIRNQAKQLQEEAKTDLEQAKKEVESMILGEDNNIA